MLALRTAAPAAAASDLAPEKRPLPLPSAAFAGPLLAVAAGVLAVLSALSFMKGRAAGGPVQTAAAERIGLVSLSSEGLPHGRLQQLEGELHRSLARSAGLQVVPPDAAFTRIARQGRLLGRRRAALDLLVRAAALVNEMRYPEALSTLQAAEKAATDGLAWVVDPKLLADIHLLRGIALLPTDRAAAEGHLQRSFALWPDREGTPIVLSPKLQEEVERAEQLARATALLPIEREDARAAARALEVDRLLVVSMQKRGDEEHARILLTYRQASAAGWAGTHGLLWPSDAPSAEVALQLQQALQSMLQEEGRGSPPPTRNASRPVIAPWIVAGVNAASLTVASLLQALLFAPFDRAQASAGWGFSD